MNKKAKITKFYLILIISIILIGLFSIPVFAEGEITNPIKVEADYSPIWFRNSKEDIILDVFDRNNQLYIPPSVKFNFSIEGVKFIEGQQNNETQIINKFKISRSAELGNHTIEVIVKDEKTIRKDIQIEIVKEKGLAQSIIGYAPEDQDRVTILNYIIWAICVIGILLLLLILALATRKDR